MRDTILTDFASALEEYTARKANLNPTHSTPQEDIARHDIDLPIQLGDLALRLGHFPSTTGYEHFSDLIVLHVVFQNAPIRVSIPTQSVSALLDQLNSHISVTGLLEVSGPLIVEHFLTLVLQKLEAVSGTTITVKSVAQKSEDATDHAIDLRLALFSNEIDLPVTPLDISGPADVITSLVTLIVTAAPLLHNMPTQQAMLALSLRTPVFAVAPDTAIALAPGDVLLLDEEYRGPESCRLWIDNAFSTATKVDYTQLVLSEAPVAETSALHGCHWCPDGEANAAQIILGSRETTSEIAAVLDSGDPVPFALHAMTQAVLHLSGVAHFTGQLVQLPGQWGLRIDQKVTQDE